MFGSISQNRMVERVQALMAKAESTPFPDEADALFEKAQALMAKYAIDEALLGTPAATSITHRKIRIENPYWRAKANLFSGIARANRVRVVWLPDTRSLHAFGSENDLLIVEMLYA